MLPLAAPILVAALLIGAGTVRSSQWTENASVLVRVGGTSSATAHVYDSNDYQRMLVVIDERPLAAVLDLATTTVFTIPRDSVRSSDDGLAQVGEVAEEYLAILDQNEGILEFAWDDVPVSVVPLPPLIGPVDLRQLLAVKPAYVTAAKEYRPDPAHLKILKGIEADTEIQVYFGTWCHLCKKLVPAMIGTVEKVGNLHLRVRYVGVDEDLTEPEAEISNHSISTTPTILVLQGGREIGRIEEKAAISIEADLAGILAPQR